MQSTQFQETFLEGGGVRLFLRSAQMPGEVKGIVLLTHGMGEHSGRYAHVAERLARHGYRLCAYDLRGHGRSDGQRGYIERYEELLDDLGRVAGHYRRNGEPMFLYGHSLGGQITLNYVLQRRPEIDGMIITAPWLQLAFRPNAFKVFLAKCLSSIWPSFTQEGPNDLKLLSRDMDFLASLPGADLMHHRMSARMYMELTRGAHEADERAEACAERLLMIHGASDPLTSTTATESFFRRSASKDKTLRIYPGMLHEPHNENERDDVLAGMVEWLDARSGGGQT